MCVYVFLCVCSGQGEDPANYQCIDSHLFTATVDSQSLLVNTKDATKQFVVFVSLVYLG